jgi:hypothetical protein
MAFAVVVLPAIALLLIVVEDEPEPELLSDEQADTPSTAAVETIAAVTTVRFIVLIGPSLSLGRPDGRVSRR